MKTSTTTAGESRRRPPVLPGTALLLAGALLLPACAAPPAPQDASSGPASSQEASSREALPERPAASATPAAPAPADAANPAPGSPASGGAASGIPVRPATPAAAAPVPAPISLTVAGTTIDMPVVPGGVSGEGAMEIPDAFDRAAWYRYGPAPGAAAGTAVIAGHIDTKSDSAPFSQLKSVASGTLIRVGREGAPAVNYRVVRVELMAKDRFDGSSVFRRSGPHELKVVTCGGKWLDERMDYSDNVIVTAVPE
ncbi:class F sortase [Pseudarthrobacter phenanthrenivorans]|uniref:class F sortase n=1 Tax=Pseudarthrobacter phenanthrenivorans TaxID=361575 RepID=UPI0002EC6214|nr:class F sortase [Pseudarthrobacter phenanthrenivorans]